VALGRLVDAEVLVPVAALDQRVGEVLDVTRGLPDPRMHEDRGVEADDVVAQLHHRTPPRALDVVLELDTERAIVPGGARAAIDLARREHESSSFRKGADLVGDVLPHQRRVTVMWPRAPVAVGARGSRR